MTAGSDEELRTGHRRYNPTIWSKRYGRYSRHKRMGIRRPASSKFRRRGGTAALSECDPNCGRLLLKRGGCARFVWRDGSFGCSVFAGRSCFRRGHEYSAEAGCNHEIKKRKTDGGSDRALVRGFPKLCGERRHFARFQQLLGDDTELQMPTEVAVVAPSRFAWRFALCPGAWLSSGMPLSAATWAMTPNSRCAPRRPRAPRPRLNTT